MTSLTREALARYPLETTDPVPAPLHPTRIAVRVNDADYDALMDFKYALVETRDYAPAVGAAVTAYAVYIANTLRMPA
jgi:hypothetical protein